jgi:hypothetical protein
MSQAMIRARAITPEACDESFRVPFLAAQGRLSEHQVPALAGVLAEDARLLVFEFIKEEKSVGYVVVKVRHKILADVQFGPVVKNPDDFVPCVNALKGVLRKRGLLLLRIMPPFGVPDYPGGEGHFNWATSVVDLDKSEDDILKSFSPNHRQSIKKALQAGIAIQMIAEHELEQYAKGHVEMFTRRGILRNIPETLRLVQGIHKLSKSAMEAPFILTARQETDIILGGAIFLRSGDTCTYYHGFAERGNPPLPVLHSLIWEAMKLARSRGCTRFDLCGISLDADDAQLKAVNDFKRWFRGTLIQNPPTVVVGLFPFVAPLLRLMKKRI